MLLRRMRGPKRDEATDDCENCHIKSYVMI
jgi:hypothetical protein